MFKLMEQLPWLRSVQEIVDIALVAVLIYSVLRLIRGTRTVQMLLGLGIFILIYWLSSLAELYTLNWILFHFLENLLLIVVVLFQNEIRRFLTRIGQTSFFPLLSSSQDAKVVEEVVRACVALSNKKIGALIVIEKDEGLGDFVELGVSIDCNVTKEILSTIFLTASPLHDGAVMIQKGRISYAACFLPLSMNPNLDSEFGTRHRAAVGLSEESDAIVICVSEEKGWISYALEGKIVSGITEDELREMLNEQLSTKVSKLMNEQAKPGSGPS